MEDEVSGSDSDVRLSVTYLRAVLLAEMSEWLHRLVYRRTFKKYNKTKRNKRRCKKIIKVRAEYLYLNAILYNFRSYENLNLCHFSFYIVRGSYVSKR